MISQYLLELKFWTCQKQYCMYELHYEYMKPKFSDLRTLYTNTDSIIYHIGTDDVYKNSSEDVNEWFDTSGYTYSKGDMPQTVNKKSNWKVLRRDW